VRDVLIFILLGSRFMELEITDDPLKSQWNDKRVGRIFCVMYSNRVGGASGASGHKLRALINFHAIQSALHGTE
jgi:hypothetical protein